LHLDDDALVKLTLSGDLGAFGVLYERYSSGVHSVAFRMLGSQDDAEDAVQEVFLRAHRSLKAFRGNARFSTWLYRIATNFCLDEIRRRKSPVSFDALSEDSSWEPEDESGANDPARQLDRSLTKEAVESALRAMSPNYRILIVLRHLEGLPYEEIASILGCSINSLNVRLHRAREAFRKAVRPYLPAGEPGVEVQNGQQADIALP